jgi:ribose 5-phosphate isomerase B
MPKVFFAADHAGFELKNALVEHAKTLGHEVEDLGAFSMDPEDDYPDVIIDLAVRVAHDPESRGVIVGGSGQGEAMCANRVKGVRAAVFYGERKATHTLEIEGSTAEDVYDVVRLARRHNDANVLSIGARFVPAQEADQALRIFLETAFSDAPRHTRRLAKF